MFHARIGGLDLFSSEKGESREDFEKKVKNLHGPMVTIVDETDPEFAKMLDKRRKKKKARALINNARQNPGVYNSTAEMRTLFFALADIVQDYLDIEDDIE